MCIWPCSHVLHATGAGGTPHTPASVTLQTGCPCSRGRAALAHCQCATPCTDTCTHSALQVQGHFEDSKGIHKHMQKIMRRLQTRCIHQLQILSHSSALSCYSQVTLHVPRLLPHGQSDNDISGKGIVKQLLVSCRHSDSLKGLCSLKAWVHVSPHSLLCQLRVFFLQPSTPCSHVSADTAVCWLLW